ncbi:MAG: helix-turn-helix domain-containing protein [Culicoidibacterales bacterium]
MEVTLKAQLSKKDIHLLAKEVANINNPKNLKNIAKQVSLINTKEVKPLDRNQKIQYTVQEVAIMVNRTPWTVRNHISIGLLSASKVGKSWLISEDNYKKYIKDGE